MSQDIVLSNISAPLKAEAELKRATFSRKKLRRSRDGIYNNYRYLVIPICHPIRLQTAERMPSRKTRLPLSVRRLVVNIGIIYETFIIKLLYSVRNWELGHIQMMRGLGSQNKPLIKEILWIFFSVTA